MSYTHYSCTILNYSQNVHHYSGIILEYLATILSKFPKLFPHNSCRPSSVYLAITVCHIMSFLSSIMDTSNCNWSVTDSVDVLFMILSLSGSPLVTGMRENHQEYQNYSAQSMVEILFVSVYWPRRSSHNIRSRSGSIRHNSSRGLVVVNCHPNQWIIE